MDNTHRKIIELIVLYMENKISKTQQEELTAWLEKDKKNRSFFQQVISPEKRMQKFETRKHAKHHPYSFNTSRCALHVGT